MSSSSGCGYGHGGKIRQCFVIENPVAADLGDYYEKTTGTANLAYIVKPDALAIFMKRDTLVESDRDILKFTTTMTASKHFVAYLYNAKKAVRIATAA